MYWRGFFSVFVCILLISGGLGAQSLEFELNYERLESEKENNDPRVTDSTAEDPVNIRETRQVKITPTMLSVSGGNMDRVYDFENSLLTYVVPEGRFT